MKNKKLFLVLVVGFVLLLVLAGILYKLLGSGNAPDSLVTLPPQTDGTDGTDQSDGTNETNDTNETSGDETSDLHLAPDFTVLDIHGNQVKLSDLRGKPVVLNFWATWCGYCKVEMPDFDKLCKEYDGEVVFMMVNLTDGESETVASAKAYIEKEGYSFPIYFDTTGEAMNDYQAYSIPLTYFIGANGEAVAYASGALSEEGLRQGIGMILPKS